MASSETDETLESYGADVGQQDGPAARFREWFLVQGDRLGIAIGLSVGVFVLFVALQAAGVVAFVNDNSVTRVASGLIAGTFSLVTLVVSINQLILSQEFASVGEARGQLEGVLEFREDVASTARVPSAPASPTRLLGLLVEAVDHRANDLSTAASEHDDPEAVDLIQAYTKGIERRTDRVDEAIGSGEFDTFTAMTASIDYDVAWQLYVARMLRGRYGDSLPSEASTALSKLIEALELFETAREHVRTTYLQRELTRFSQLTIYAGVPSILAAVTIGLLYADVTGPSVNVVGLPYVVSALIAVAVSPLMLLVTYILRTATVTRRTSSTGPMVPQKDPQAGPFDVTYGEDRE